MQRMIDGLSILIKYCDDGEATISAEHEVIYCGPDTNENISKEDAEKLEELGFHFDESDDCFYAFT